MSVHLGIFFAVMIVIAILFWLMDNPFMALMCIGALVAIAILILYDNTPTNEQIAESTASYCLGRGGTPIAVNVDYKIVCAIPPTPTH